MQVCWEQAFLCAPETEQGKDVSLKIREFGKDGESRGILSLADATGVLASRGEVLHQGL